MAKIRHAFRRYLRHSEIEAALEQRIPSALTPSPKILSGVNPTGIEPLDDLLNGGLPQGAITKFVGPECSGRTSIALSFLAQITNQEKVCAWIDVSDTLDPESAAAAGVDLRRLLWLRCGAGSDTVRPASYNFKQAPEKYLRPASYKKRPARWGIWSTSAAGNPRIIGCGRWLLTNGTTDTKTCRAES